MTRQILSKLSTQKIGMSQNKKLVLGTFNSEYHWKNDNLATLPSFQDQNADLILSAMDELLFVFCDSNEDILLTKFPFNNVLFDYLNDIGFNFSNKIRITIDSHNYEQNIFSLLSNNEIKSFQDIINPGIKFLPYSIIPDTELLFKKYKISTSIPSIDIVREVNSKAYSHHISKKISTKNKDFIVFSAEELENRGLNLLKERPFLIKETMGVSGKGNIAITTGKMLNRIIKHISKQEIEGKKVLLICEPLYDKKIDFSCQIEIKETGQYDFVSLQQMHNRGFAFHGMQTLTDDLLKNFLYTKGYFEKIDLVVKELVQSGYFGPVCIDSMITKNNEIIPIIEINARKSMGLINHYLDKFLSKRSLKGKLLYFTLVYKEKVDFEIILDKLNSKNLLFTNKNLSGILPLSSNTLYVNNDYGKNNKNSENKRGRLYFSIISKSNDEENKTINDTKMVFNTLNFDILN